MAETGKTNDAFWALADRRAELAEELKMLTRGGGAPRGFSVAGLRSPKRRRAEIVAAEFQDVEQRFRRAQADFAAMMRARVKDSEMAATHARAGAVAHGPPEAMNEFAAARARVRSSAVEGNKLRDAMARMLASVRPKFE